MKRGLPRLRPLALLGCLLLAGAAHADVIDDVWRGTNIQLNTARIRVDGNDYSTRSWTLPKSANTLNLNVPARQFGFDSNLVLHMYGTRSGNRITWTFNDRLPSDYYVGSSSYITRIRGTLVAQATLVRGSDDPICDHQACPHNVQLSLVSAGTRVWIDGYTDIIWEDDWTEEVYVQQFIAYGGVPRPRMSAVAVTLPTSLCASETASELTGEAWLSSVAPVGGTLVNLWSVDASVGVMNVRVPQGQRSARFQVRLPPNWVGPTVINGASGGVQKSYRVALRKCVRVHFPFNIWQVLSTLRFQPIFLTTTGSFIGRYKESDFFVSASGAELSLAELIPGAKQVRVTGVTAAGVLFGTATTDKGPRAFRWRVEDVEKKVGPDLNLDGWVSVGGNAQGTPLVVPQNDPKAYHLVDEVGPRKIAALADIQTTRVLFNMLGDVAATQQTTKGPRAVRIIGKDVKALVDSAESEVVAMNDRGLVLGVSRTSAQGPGKLFTWSEKQGLVWVATPKGYASAEGVSVDAGGFVLGNAVSEDGKTRLPFLMSPDGTVKALSSLIPADVAKAGYVLQQALSMTEDQEVLVAAVNAKGERVYLVVSP